MTYRVLQTKASLDEVVALVDSVMASYRVTGDVAAHFRSVPRDLGAGVQIAFPIELTDPFPWERDDSGVLWMYFRRHRAWADDPDRPEQTEAVAAFFAPGDAAQERAARGIVARRAAGGLLDPASARESVERAGARPSAVEVVHQLAARGEPSWLASAVDPAAGVAVAYRVWSRDAGREEAVAVVERATASYRFSGNPSETFFPTPGTDPAGRSGSSGAPSAAAQP